jgi:hypothetical protein
LDVFFDRVPVEAVIIQERFPEGHIYRNAWYKAVEERFARPEGFWSLKEQIRVALTEFSPSNCTFAGSCLAQVLCELLPDEEFTDGWNRVLIEHLFQDVMLKNHRRELVVHILSNITPEYQREAYHLLREFGWQVPLVVMDYEAYLQAPWPHIAAIKATQSG